MNKENMLDISELDGQNLIIEIVGFKNKVLAIYSTLINSRMKLTLNNSSKITVTEAFARSVAETYKLHEESKGASE